jgi:hypothetical protein
VRFESEYVLSGYTWKYMVMDSEKAGKCAYIVRSFVAFATGLTKLEQCEK